MPRRDALQESESGLATLGNGLTSDRTYDDANRMLTLLNRNGPTTISSYTYTFDNVGNRSQVVDTTGTTTYGYDNLYRLTGVTYPNNDTQGYTYDAQGNRLAKVQNGTSTSYTYDDAGQMTTAGATSYAYDNNGNTVAAGANTYAWDAENHLSGTTIGGVTATYAYDGVGLRTSRTIGGVTNTYAWDLTGTVAHVLQDNAGNKYVYGLGLISKTNGTAQEYYLTDGLGSTTGITDNSGNVTGTYAYDAFGVVRSQTGATTESSYTGEQNDPTGLEYLRARYYDASIGRFLSQDPLPLLQRYAYANDNPANLIDPSGMLSVQDAASDVYAIAKQILNDPCWLTQIFCPHPALHWKTVGRIIRSCLSSDTCVRWVGEGVFITGIVTGNPFIAAIGVGMVSGVDAPGCVHGSGWACVNLAIDATMIAGVAGGSVASTPRINITEDGLTHIAERHMPGGAQATANKSVFNAGEDITDLIRAAGKVEPTVSGSNLVRVANAGRIIGIDRTTQAPTSDYTVVTDLVGNLITAYPGLP